MPSEKDERSAPRIVFVDPNPPGVLAEKLAELVAARLARRESSSID